MSRAKMSRSSTAGRKMKPVGCRHWRPSWSAVRWPRLPRPARLQHSGQGGNRDYPDRLRDRVRPGGAWARRQPEPAWRQRHGRDQLGRRGSVEAAGAAARAGPDCNPVALLVNPAILSRRRSVARCARAAGKLGLKLHVLHASTERDFDTALRKLGPTAGRCARDWRRCILH